MRYIGNKAIRLVFIILAVSALTFLMVDLMPGDAAFGLAGHSAVSEDVEALRKELGLDRPIAVRYLEWGGRALTGDLGESYRTGEKVLDAILARLPVTVELMVLAQALALLLAVPVSMVSAYRAGRLFDRVASAIAFSFMALPVFVLSILLIFIFAIRLHWLPATGYTPLSSGLLANLSSFTLPAMSIALVEWVPLMRVLRSDMVGVLKEDYILMARSKGLPVRHVLLRHALRPSSFTLVTILGIQIGHLIGGAVIVETIFALPGMGRLLIGAIFSQDAIMVQGCVLFITVGYVTVNFLVDLLYTLLDPRVRKEDAVA